ncbi:MAG TPA: Uma2 family endonuclease [Polyangiaceae bacterium]|nr:Uma2 family endonuclease [Polyangiaceae bacterium]
MALSIDERQHRFSHAEYLVLAESSTLRLENWAGRILDMSGGSPQHSRICANLLRVLGNQLAGKACQPYDSNLRVRSIAANRTTYADVTVVCGALDLDPDDRAGHTVLNPSLLVEVLSPTTERDDRGAKLDCYKAIASVRAIALVDQERPEVTLHSRQPDGSWRQTVHTTGDVELAAIACRLPLDEIYADLPPG